MNPVRHSNHVHVREHQKVSNGAKGKKEDI